MKILPVNHHRPPPLLLTSLPCRTLWGGMTEDCSRPGLVRTSRVRRLLPLPPPDATLSRRVQRKFKRKRLQRGGSSAVHEGFPFSFFFFLKISNLFQEEVSAPPRVATTHCERHEPLDQRAQQVLRVSVDSSPTVFTEDPHYAVRQRSHSEGKLKEGLLYETGRRRREV